MQKQQGQKVGVGVVQAKENRERGKAETLNRKQAPSEETAKTVERTTVKWPEQNTIQFFSKGTCDLGSRRGVQCDVQCLWQPPSTPRATVSC